jgi:hypothetical protein
MQHGGVGHSTARQGGGNSPATTQHTMLHDATSAKVPGNSRSTGGLNNSDRFLDLPALPPLPRTSLNASTTMDAAVFAPLLPATARTRTRAIETSTATTTTQHHALTQQTVVAHTHVPRRLWWSHVPAAQRSRVRDRDKDRDRG